MPCLERTINLRSSASVGTNEIVQILIEWHDHCRPRFLAAPEQNLAAVEKLRFFSRFFDSLSIGFIWPSFDTLRKTLSSFFSSTNTSNMASKLAIRPGTSAFRSISRRRPSICHTTFSTTSPAAAVSPHKSKNLQKKIGQSKRPATTAAAPSPETRQIPSPAFNQDFRRNEPSPLINRQMPELDDS